MTSLVFLKLGGSLITDKDQPHTPRLDVLQRLAVEIAAARAAMPEVHLLIGHGSGSFGHTAARKHATRSGVNSAAGWQGFAEVWREARALNQLVVEALSAVGVPVIAFPPSAYLLAREGQACAWDHRPILAALDHNLVPLVNGDAVFDEAIGGTILSTEDIFAALTPLLKPKRILLAGIEPGVWENFPTCTRIVARIDSHSYPHLGAGLGASASVDVTGGMRQKVDLMYSLAQTLPGLESLVFSGLQPGSLFTALTGDLPATRITYP
jgi:isopentenyl phosphate kinase